MTDPDTRIAELTARAEAAEARASQAEPHVTELQETGTALVLRSRRAEAWAKRWKEAARAFWYRNRHAYIHVEQLEDKADYFEGQLDDARALLRQVLLTPNCRGALPVDIRAAINEWLAGWRLGGVSRRDDVGHFIGELLRANSAIQIGMFGSEFEVTVWTDRGRRDHVHFQDRTIIGALGKAVRATVVAPR